jgi:hypothetical protein
VATTSREIVQAGVATFFGGATYDTEARAYRGAIPTNLLAAGLSTVRAHQSKRVSDFDYVMNQAAGRGMGAYMVVEIPQDGEIRVSVPAGSGRKKITYRVILHLFHLAYQPHMEDAEADVNGLIEAIRQQIRGDVTLGGICYQAGESRFGIQTRVRPSIVADNEVTGTEITITFEVQVMIVA